MKTISKTLYSALVLGLFAASPVFAGVQEGHPPGQWSLEDCIGWALDHNISVQQQALAVEQKEINLNTDRNSRLPDLNASASENLSFGRGLTQDNTYANTNTTSTNFSLGTSANLFNGFRTNNQIKYDKLDLESANLSLEKAKNDIRVAVAQAYVQVLFKKQIVQVAVNQVNIDSLQVERLAAMKEVGKAGAAELAQQKASLGQSRLSLVQARNDLKLSLLDLSQLLELPSPEDFDIAPLDPSGSKLPLVSPQDIYDEAVLTWPEVLAQQRLSEAGQYSIKIAKSALYPSLNFSAGIGTNYYSSSNAPHTDSFSLQAKNNFSQYLSLSLNIPIFNRFATRNNIRLVRLNVLNQKLQVENAKKGLFKEIQQAYYNAVAADQKLVQCGDAMASAKASFDLMKGKYENGLANITEFNESKSAYLQAESNLLQAQYESLYQNALIGFYRSGEISL